MAAPQLRTSGGLSKRGREMSKSSKTIARSTSKVVSTRPPWCLADTLSTYSNAAVLMFDLDAYSGLPKTPAVSHRARALSQLLSKVIGALRFAARRRYRERHE